MRLQDLGESLLVWLPQPGSRGTGHASSPEPIDLALKQIGSSFVRQRSLLSSERWSLRSAWPGQQASRRLTAVTRLETLFLLKSVRGATDGPTPTHPTTEPLSCFAGARGDLEGVVGVAGG